MSYCTAADVKRHLGIVGTTDDALIAALIATATNAINQYCHREFTASADTTRYIDAVGMHIQGRSLFLDDIGDICAITTVVNGDGNTVTSGQYTVYPRNETPYTEVRLLGSAGKTWTYTDDPENAIAITGRWAYSTTAPAAIEQACVDLAAFYYRQKDQPFTDVTAIEAGVVMRPVGMPAHIKPLLAGYIRL